MQSKLFPNKSQAILSTKVSAGSKRKVLPPIADKPLKQRKNTYSFTSLKSAWKESLSGLRRYVLLRTIGTGSSARIRLAIDRVTSVVNVAKIVSKGLIVLKNQLEYVLRETNLLKEMHSPFIVSLRDNFQDENFLYLVLEYVQGGDLYTFLERNGNVEPVDARLYASEVVCALSHFHTHNTVYRDLKPENVLITYAGHIKLADLGFAKKLDRFEQTFSFCGTPEYIAPEVVEKAGHGFPCDWWQLGVLIYEMLVGHAPYQADNPYELYGKILTEDVSFPQEIALNACSLITSLLIKDPLTRATEVQVRAHPYFAGVAWKDVEQLRNRPTYRPKIRNPLDASNFNQYEETNLPIDVVKSTDPELFRDF